MGCRASFELLNRPRLLHEQASLVMCIVGVVRRQKNQNMKEKKKQIPRPARGAMEEEEGEEVRAAHVCSRGIPTLQVCTFAFFFVCAATGY